MSVFYYSDYDCWKTLYDSDRESYRREKESVAKIIIEHLERYYPGLKEQIKAMDISTPVTAERYTGNYKGTVMAWVPFGDTEDYVKPLINKYRMQLSGLSNFYMCGHWLSTGALVRAAASGRFVTQFICKNDGRRFNASLEQKKGVGRGRCVKGVAQYK
jgi:phytoene dehydrogenase-like protein